MDVVARDLHPNQGRLEDARTRRALIAALVTGASFSNLARRFGVSYQAVQAFARRHRARILGLAVSSPCWAEDKRAVLAECARLVEEVETLAANTERAALGPAVEPKLERLAASAEALGRYHVRPDRRACA